jgi:hypothetical protein
MAMQNPDTTNSQSFAVDPRVTNPKAHEYHTIASTFVEDATLLQGRVTAGRYMLLMHGIELALKSFLHENGGVDFNTLWRDYGHDLSKLLNKSLDVGLVLNEPDTQAVVNRLNDAGEQAKIRYTFDFEDMPGIDTVLRVARRLLDDTKPSLASP